MEKSKSIPNGIINPFSELFLETWNLWKYWRKNEHDNFEYKGVISEQMALKNLSELAQGEEPKAIKIIEQSIDRGWSGFYKVKNFSTNATKQATVKPIKSNNADEASVSAVLNKRFGGEQPFSGDQYLKVV